MSDQQHQLEAGRGRNLALATLAFTISFWAWNMIAPLAVTYTQEMGLDGNQKALLVATPVLVGALGRILAGALTDRFGGRLMMPTLILASVPFVLLVAVAGNARSFGLMLVFGFFLGIAGTTFAVGVPMRSAGRIAACASGCGPAITSAARATSPTVRPSGPT